MSLSTIDTRQYHALYGRLPHAVRLEIDMAYRAAVLVFRNAKLAVRGDDPAEMLIAGLTHYVLAANPTLHEQLLADPADQPYRPAAASVSTDNIDAGDVFP